MKKVVARGTEEGARAIEELIREKSLPYRLLVSTLEPATVTVYVPDEMLDDLLARIKDFPGFGERSSIIEVSSPDFVVSPLLEELKAGKKTKQEKIAEKPVIEQLVESAEPHGVLDTNKVVLAAIAGLVALTGLFLNNVGIVIGAMLISPLLGPIYAFAVNTATGNSKNVLDDVRVLAALLLMVIAISFATTYLLSRVTVLSVTPEIASRLAAPPVFVVMAFLLGFATIAALSKGIPEGVAGVAVAAALLPPAVAFGIALVLAPAGAPAALTLTLENVIGLVLGGVVAVIILGVRPRGFFEQWKARQVIRRVLWILAILFVLILILSLLVGLIAPPQLP